MCIGANQPGGPKRCPDDSSKRCDRAVDALDRNTVTVNVIDAERHYEQSHIDYLEMQRRAIMGELSAEEEQVLLLRATLRHGEVPANGVPGDADAALLEGLDPDRDYRSEYEHYLAQATLAGDDVVQTFEEYIAYERAEAAEKASLREWEADTASGYYERMERELQVDLAREAAAGMTAEQARAHIDERVTAPEFEELLAARDDARARKAAAEERWEQVKGGDDVAAIAAARDVLYDAHCDYLVAADDLSAYQDQTAQYAARVAQDIDFPAYESDRLGDCVKVGEFTPGSREWLEQHQLGIGGSDVGVLLGVKDPKDLTTSTDVKLSKLTPITDEQLAEQAISTTQFTGATGRGNAWEPVIAKQFADENPDLTVMHTKATWRHPDRPFQQINVDALLSSNGVDPDGILEIKTGNDAAKWADGIPLGYRAQPLNYQDATGFKYAYVAAQINDRDYRCYRIDFDEPVSGVEGDPTFAQSRDRLEGYWTKWQEEKANPPAPKQNSSTFAWVKNPKAESSVAKNRKVAAELASYRGISNDDAYAMIQKEVAAGAAPDAAVRGLYRSYDPTTDTDRRYLVFDTETNSLSSGKGEVIQSGAVLMNGRGEVFERIDELHGLDPRAARTVGTGAGDIHQIRYEQIHGKPQFRQSTAHRRVGELLADPKVTMVAHNAGFEKRFLAASGIRADRIIDTMNLSKRFDHHVDGAKLEQFVTAHGVEYRNGHNAYADADMTARGLLGFWRDLQKMP